MWYFSTAKSVENIDEIIENEELVDESTEESEELVDKNIDNNINEDIEKKDKPDVSFEWIVYTNDEWKYSFTYPSNYNLVEEKEGVKIVLTPPGEIEKKSDFFSVYIVQYPDIEEIEMLPKALFHRANLPNGKLAWLKKEEAFDYEKDYLINIEEITFGIGDNFAFKVREKSITPDLGEYRSKIYIPRDPAVYRITHDFLAEKTYGEIIKKIEDSFEVLE